MQVYLTTKAEISKENEILELLKLHFPEYNIRSIIKPRKYKGRQVNQEKIIKPKEVKVNTKDIRKKKCKRIKIRFFNQRLARLEAYEDYYYNKKNQEQGIENIIEHYTRLKNISW